MRNYFIYLLFFVLRVFLDIVVAQTLTTATINTEPQVCNTWQDCEYNSCMDGSKYGCSCQYYRFSDVTRPGVWFTYDWDSDFKCISFYNIADTEIQDWTCYKVFIEEPDNSQRYVQCPSNNTNITRALSTSITSTSSSLQTIYTASSSSTLVIPTTTATPTTAIQTTAPMVLAPDLAPLVRVDVAWGESCTHYLDRYVSDRGTWRCDAVTDTSGCNGTWLRVQSSVTFVNYDIFACPWALGRGCTLEPDARPEHCWMVCEAGCAAKVACTNLPSGAYYTGSGTNATNCPWECNDNYLKLNGECIFNEDYALAPAPPSTTQLRCGSFQQCGHCPRRAWRAVYSARNVWGCSGYELYEHNINTNEYTPQDVRALTQLFKGYCAYWLNWTYAEYCVDPVHLPVYTYTKNCTTYRDCEYCPGTQYPNVYHGPFFIFGCYGYWDQVIMRQAYMEDMPYTQTLLDNYDYLTREFSNGTCIYYKPPEVFYASGLYVSSVPYRCPDRDLHVSTATSSVTVLATTTTSAAVQGDSRVRCATIFDCDQCNVTLPQYYGCSGVVVVYKFANGGVGLHAPNFVPPATEFGFCVVRSAARQWRNCVKKADAASVTAKNTSMINFAFRVESAAVNETLQRTYEEIIARLLRLQRERVKVNTGAGVDVLGPAGRRLLQSGAAETMYASMDISQNETDNVKNTLASPAFAASFQAAALESGLPAPYLLTGSVVDVGTNQVVQGAPVNVETTPRAVQAPAVYAREVTEPSQGFAWTVWLVVPVAVAVLGICVALWVYALEKPKDAASRDRQQYSPPTVQMYQFKRHLFQQNKA